MLTRRTVTMLALVLAASLQACALAWPFELSIGGIFTKGQPSGWLQCLCMSVWALISLRIQSPKAAFKAGWLFATAWLSAVFWWLYVSMHEVAGMSAWLAGMAVLALASALGLYYAAMSAACKLIRPHVLLWPFVFASAWTLAELMRAQWFTGFPWGAVGYAHADSWLGSWAPLVGVYGVGWMAAFSAAIVALFCQRAADGTLQRKPRSFGGLTLTCLAIVAAPAVLTSAAPQSMQWGQASGSFKAELLQANIRQTEKFDSRSAVIDAMTWYTSQTQKSTADLVLAPETAIPLFEHQLPNGYLKNMLGGAAKKKSLMIGIPLADSRKGYANAVIAVTQGDALPAKSDYTYLKHHLVPFGEFVPPLFRWFTDLMRIPLGDFYRGPQRQSAYTFMGQRLMPNICYEDLFGEEWALNFLEPEQAPTVMVNFSNIAWFGKTIAVDQHLQISRMRALEFQRPVLRATNSGATALIDRQAKVQALLAAHQRASLQVEVTGTQGTVTPYARWAGEAGLLPLWVWCLALCFAGLVINRTKSSRIQA